MTTERGDAFIRSLEESISLLEDLSDELPRAVLVPAAFVAVVSCSAISSAAPRRSDRMVQVDGQWRTLPEWVRAEEVRAPQLPDLARTFMAHDAPLDPKGEPTLLVCQVDSSTQYYWDTFAGPDLQTRLGIGKDIASVRGPEDRWGMVFSVPAVRLTKGTPVHVQVYDRDVTEWEGIGDEVLRFDGALPIKLRAKHFSFECRGVDGTATALGADAALAAADSALDGLAVPVPIDLRQDDFGHPAEHVQDARYQLKIAAAHVGWADRRPWSRLESVEAFERDWKERFGAAFDATAGRLPAPGEWTVLERGRLRARVVEISCRKGLCAVSVEVENLSRKALRASELLGSELISRDGERRRLSLDDAGSLELVPGAKATLPFTTDCARCDGPLLLRTDRYETGQLLRVQ